MTIKEILREIVLGSDSSNAIAGINFMATVESVDAKKYTCSVKLLGGEGILEDVRLKAENEKDYGVVSIPEKGSFVVVSILGSEAGAFVSLCSKLQKIEVKIGDQTMEIDKNGFVFNGGVNGMVLIDKLVQKLNALEQAINTHTHPYVNVSAPSNTSVTTSLMTPTQQSEIENTKIKQ